jgi:cytochrome c oxidase subunit I
MPRRVPDYPDIFSFLQFGVNVGSYITFVGLLVFFVNLWISFSKVDVVEDIQN